MTGADVDAAARNMRAHAPGPSYQDMLDADTHAVPLLLRVQSAENLDLSDVPAERYFSREVHELEKQADLDPGLAARLPRGGHPRGR